MTKREVVKTALEGKKVPYVPWCFGFTIEAMEKLKKHFHKEDLSDVLQNHICNLGAGPGYFEDIGNERYKDPFGVVWNKAEEKDTGIVEGQVLKDATLEGYKFPEHDDKRFFSNISDRGDGTFRIYNIGFSLFERAWTMRGMETLMMDFYDSPEFVRDLLRAIADHNIAKVKKALNYDIDAVQFGDDWGQQRGLIMGPDLWHEFLYPEIRRMYKAVKDAGKYVFIHSCGDVDELFDDLVDAGLDCFNPFQPEVMDTEALMKQYKGRLSFFGGLSTQRILPYGTVDDVKKETLRLIELGMDGNYIFAPAHAVEGDVPLENMLAFIETVQSQPGYKNS